MQRTQPKIGLWYREQDGASFEVISLGTKGVIVEYDDGHAELIDQGRWDSLHLEYESRSLEVDELQQ